MKLTITNQFQEFLKSIGADIAELLQRAEVPNKLWQEEISLTTLEYHRLLQKFDRVMSEENIRALSQISQIQMFVQPSLRPCHHRTALRPWTVLPASRRLWGQSKSMWSRQIRPFLSPINLPTPTWTCLNSLFSMSSCLS